MTDGNRHDLYISKIVWGELKQRAFIEEMTASGLIAYLLDWAIHNPAQIPDLARYHARSRAIGEDRTRRTVRGIPDALWAEAEKVARQGSQPSSVSGLVEALLRNYLGLSEEEDAGESPDENAFQPDTGHLQTGRVTFDLGQGAQEIDLKPKDE